MTAARIIEVAIGRAAAERSRTHHADPVAFARDALGVELWSRQAEVARAVATHPRVAVRSGHKVGKSLLAAVLALWWVSTRPRGAVVFTAPTARQVDGIVWREIRRLVQGAKVPFPPPAKRPGLGIQWDDGRYLVGFSTDDSTRMAGISGDEVLFIVDEGSGVDEQIYEAIEGNRAGGARVFVIGNPTAVAGTFYDAFHTKRDFWRTFHISSEHSPNVTAGRTIVRGLAERYWVEEKRAEWGEDSPLYQVRVAGDFPDQSSNAVIPIALVDRARERWDDTEANGRLELGVDVARFGDDDTAVVARRGQKVLEVASRNGFAEERVVDLVLEVVRRHHVRGERHPLVKVDEIGVGLAVLALLRQRADLDVYGVNVAEKSDEEGEYPNKRSQLWFAAADWLRSGGAIPADSKLEGELVAPTYSIDLRGRRQVEKKDDFKKRLGRSPDRADALCLAVYSMAAPNYRPTRERQSRWGDAARGF